MTDSDEKQRALDASMENEGRESQTGYGPMVQISLKFVANEHGVEMGTLFMYINV